MNNHTSLVIKMPGSQFDAPKEAKTMNKLRLFAGAMVFCGLFSTIGSSAGSVRPGGGRFGIHADRPSGNHR